MAHRQVASKSKGGSSPSLIVALAPLPLPLPLPFCWPVTAVVTGSVEKVSGGLELVEQRLLLGLVE